MHVVGVMCICGLFWEEWKDDLHVQFVKTIVVEIMFLFFNLQQLGTLVLCVSLARVRNVYTLKSDEGQIGKAFLPRRDRIVYACSLALYPGPILIYHVHVEKLWEVLV